MQKQEDLNQVSECTFAPAVSPERRGYLKGYNKLERDINK